MAARIIEICEAIVAEINAEFPEANASRGYAPVLKNAPEPEEIVSDVSARQVRVIPRTRVGTSISRAITQYDYQFVIGIYKRVAVDQTTGEPNTSEVDGLIEFAENLERFFTDNHQIAGLSSPARATANETLIYDLNSMRDAREFRSFITLTVMQGRR